MTRYDVLRMDADSWRWAGILWNYLHLGHQLSQSDVIICLGCHDVRVAEKAAALYLEGWAPWILFTGHHVNHTEGVWDQTEAEVFARIAIKMGVPEDRILLEKKASNTGENIRFSWQVLNERNIPANRVILVQQPFMERRVLATFLRQWPGDKENTQALVTSPTLGIEEYHNETAGGLAKLIGYMLATVERIRDYPSKGFQVEQHISPEALEAYSELQTIGYRAK
ncbi:uncharacterized protein SCO4629-like [Ambystoma mexicanum]|uniref:uncharacterized protein SCO4629-like n=1 Tax=Ambystoma mexicanum TaxID=8296 RepID=UPI0037E88CEB